jgi:hypothetical protein
MEYIIFRMLRLIDREIDMYEQLFSCMVKQHDNIINGKVLDLLVDMLEQKEILMITSNIETDIKEEITDLARHLKLRTKCLNITIVVETLKPKYPKLCQLFEIRGRKLESAINKVDKINTQNISMLQNYKTIWQDILPLYNAWQEFDTEGELEPEAINEQIFEISLN